MRMEIAAALARGKLVVPVLIDDAAIPPASLLPRDIRPLAYHQTHHLRRTSSERDLKRLGDALREQLPRHYDAQRDRRRYRFGLGALALAIGLAVAAVWHASRPNRPNEAATPESSVVAGACAETVTFACLRAGLVRGHIDSDLRQTECSEERTYLPAELGWRSIWTTSVYSYAPGDSGPGGGLENDILRVGGWNDLYYTLMQFETPKLSRPVRFAAVLLFAKVDDGIPVAMHFDRITRSWGWKAGDRLWWKDRPSAVNLASITSPAPDQWYVIEITQLLEDWREGRTVNHGLQLRPAANQRHYSTFHSTRSLETSKQPRLLVCT
jgi:hypothetical protein